MSEALILTDGGKRQFHFTSDRDGTPARYLINADGSAITRLEVPPGARTASVFADGSRVLVGAGDWTKMQLFSATFGQSVAKQITPDDGAYWCPAFSRDGARIAVARMDASRAMQVWVMQADGSGAKEVTRFTKAEGSPQCPAWSPDGRRLAVQSEVRDAADTTKFIGNIWVIDLESGRATKLAEHGAPYQDEVPSWFPDGKRIAFQSNRTVRRARRGKTVARLLAPDAYQSRRPGETGA